MNNLKENFSEKTQNGNACLLGGVGLGAFGTTLALSANFVCPVCMIGTPILLGIGGWQKYKYLKSNSKSSQTPPVT